MDWVKKWFPPLLKLALLIFAIYMLVTRIDSHDWQQLSFRYSAGLTTAFFAAFAGLSFLNHWLDAVNWKRVQSILKPISKKTALLQNIKCMGLAFVTPANAGELAGRYLLQSEKEHRKRAAFLTFWMHMPKLASKLLISIPALSFLFYLQNPKLISWLPVVAGLWLTILTGYFLTKKVINAIARLRIRKLKLEDYIVNNRPTTVTKFYLLSLSGVRFLAYNLQFGGLLVMLSQGSLPYTFWFAIPAFYLITTVIPTWNAFDFLIKGVVAVYFFQQFTDNNALVVLSSTAVWLMNMALPATLGLALVKPSEIRSGFRWKWKSENHYERVR